jgi:SWI/SNF-related matrix-associated actin-dependent regulator of chromatin subfamily A3
MNRYRLTQYRYKHRLTKARESLRVNECRGGLLADEMGMGKSLSVLTLIVHTLEAAQLFEARRFDDDGKVLTRQTSGATLIAAPKSSTSKKLPFDAI